MAVAIACYYFNSVTDAVAPLLNLTNSRSSSDAINKVAAAHLCLYGRNVKKTLRTTGLFELQNSHSRVFAFDGKIYTTI